MHLGEALVLQRGFDLPTQERGAGTVPVVSSAGVSGRHDRAKVEPPGVVTGRYGTVGEVFFLTEPFWPLNTTLFVKDFKGNDPRFCFYLLKSLDFTAFMDKSGVPGVNRNHLHTIQVSIPPIGEQRAIGDALGALDDKIDVNRQMAETLEEIARALFQSWFVDFDPVRGTATVPDDIRRLFPDRLVDSPIGPVPAGWTIGSFGELVASVGDQVDPRQLPPATPYIGLEHMPRGRVTLDDWASTNALVSGKRAFVAGDILWGKLRPYFHKVGIAPVDGVCSTDILVLRALDPMNRSFALMIAASDRFVDRANAASTGTRMPRASWGDMASFPLVLPPAALSKRFEATVEPMLALLVAGVHENRLLAELRDTLLPRLVSGELRMPVESP